MAKRAVNSIHPENSFEKPSYILEFQDEFDSDQLNTKKWIPFYLPQWSSKENSKPNFRFENSNLILSITEDQKPWCPEFNGDVKVSSLQTGLFAGSLGSTIGQHRFNGLCRVREEQETIRKYVPQYGYFEMRARVDIAVNNVAALWLIGFEDTPDKSAEICIFELKGHNIGINEAVIGFGVHPFGDTNIKDEFFEEKIKIDVTQYHLYAIDWSESKIDFFIDNQKVKTVNQSPNYPMQLMLNIYEVPTESSLTENELNYPKDFWIDYVRVFSHQKLFPKIHSRP